MSAIQKKKILIVEDEKVIVDLLVKEVRAAGYDVAVAYDGIEGSEKVISYEPDLILLDLLLPHKSGYELLHDLKVENRVPKLPVIVFSNSGQPAEVERILAMGAREVLTKVNFDPSDVVDQIQLFFEGGSVKKNENIQGGQSMATHILIVEDDPFIGELEIRKFRSEGFDVHHAIDAEQALVILQERVIDIVLLDIMLPGKDGLTFLKELRAIPDFVTLPVIIASNLGQQEEIDAGRAAGATDYIIKANFMPSEIVSKVQKIIEDRSR